TRGAHASTASGFGFCPFRVRTKTCPLFQSPVGAAFIPRDCRREIVVPDLRPTASGLSVCLPGCEPKPVRFFSPESWGASYPVMNPDADTSDLFPDFSAVPQMVFVNDSVSLQ